MLGNASYIINCCTQCFVGCSLFTAIQPGQASHESELMARVSLCMEILITVVVTIVIGIIAKNILEKKLKEQKQREEEQPTTKYLK